MVRKYTRKPRRGTRRVRRATGGWMNTAKKALKIATRVAGLVNAEAKDYYLIQAVGATGNTGLVFSLNGGIVQGVADGQRTGDSVKIKTLTLRYDISRPAVDEIVRCIIIWDKEILY